MNVFKRQLKIPTTIVGIKKAISTGNLTEDTSPAMSFDSRPAKASVKSNQNLSMQDFTDTLNTLYSNIHKASNDDFISEDLPSSLNVEWLSRILNAENSKYLKKTSATIELLSTELSFLNQMQFLLDISAKVFSAIQPKSFPNIEIEEIFLNIGEIYEVNYQFWTKYLYPSYQIAKETDELISCSGWKEGFEEMQSLFFPYQQYCSKMIQCQKRIQSMERDSKYFAHFSQWFSHVDQANRESLSDFIAKPFQRLTKYALLLNTIYKFSDDAVEQNHLMEMVSCVDIFVKEIEKKMFISQISMRLDPIELVEAPTDDLIELCIPYRTLDLTAPIKAVNGDFVRTFDKHGIFRMKEAQSKFIDVSCLLFTDFLLICQKVKNIESDRIKVVRPIISLNKLNVISTTTGSLILRVFDDYGCLTAMYLLNGEPSTINEWMTEFSSHQSYLKELFGSVLRPFDKLSLPPKVNVIRASPICGRSATLNSISYSGSISPKFNRSLATFNYNSFGRTSFRSSPMMRKRTNTLSNGKDGHLTWCGDSSSNDLDYSTQCQKYQSANLEDANNDLFETLHSSQSSIDLQSPNPSLNSLAIKNEHINGIDELNRSQTSIRKTKSDPSNGLTERLKQNRQFRSMMNVSENINE